MNDYYGKLLLVTLLLIIHLFFNDCVCSSTQLNSQNADLTIDSLLLEGDVGTVKQHYDNYEYERYTSKELEVLFINIDFLTILDLNRMDEYVNHYKTLSDQFNIDYAGENAYKAYDKFLQLSDQMVKTEALKYYYISLFFKVHHFNIVLTSARNIYSQANRLSSELKFSEALDTLDNFTMYPGQNTQLMAIEDSLEFLRQDIFNQQMEYGRTHKTDLRTYTLFVGIIPSFQYYPVVSDATITIENAVSSFLGVIEPSSLKEIHIKDIPATYRFELSLGINYSILRKLMIGLDFGYTAFSMKGKEKTRLDEDNVFYDFKLRSTILKPYLKYLFSERIGARPFVNAGISFQSIQYADGTGGSFIWYPYPESYPAGIHTDYGDISKSETRIGVFCEAGAEFIPSTSSVLLYGFKFGGYYFFHQVSVLNDYNFNLSLYAGLIL